MWGLFLAFAVFSILAALLAPKQQTNKPKPSALGDFQFPTAEEGRAVPVIMGTVKMRAPNVTWYGDLGTVEMTQRVKTGPCSSTNVTKGYKYYVGMQLSLCMGQVDELKEIWVADKKAWSGSCSRPDNGQPVIIYVNTPGLFGGDESEGGIQGDVAFFFGTPNQNVDPYYATMVGKNISTSTTTVTGGSILSWVVGLVLVNAGFNRYFYGAHTTYWENLLNNSSFNKSAVPSFRHVCYASLRQMYVGTSTYIKPWYFVLKRIPCSITDCKQTWSEINGDANPAEMIFELLTNELWGLGMSRSLIDTYNFRSVANTLYTEGTGLSMQFDAQTKAQNLIDEILRHIDASLYVDNSTGLVKLKLIRADYNVNDLPVYDQSSIKSFELSRVSWPETYNEAKVNYTDRASDFADKVAQAIDLANYRIQGGDLVSQTFDFKGFSNATAAAQAAVRCLKVISYPLAKAKMVTNRKAYGIVPGDVIKVSWPPLGIYNQVFRVTAPNYGSVEEGEIELDIIEDIYGTPSAVYVPPPGSGGVDPVNVTPTDLTYKAIVETPYFYQGSNRWVSTIAVRNNPNYYQYEVWTTARYDNAYNLEEIISAFTPAGILVNDYARNTAMDDPNGFIITPLADLERLQSISTSDRQLGNCLVAIDGEIMAWATVRDLGDGTFKISNILRGVMDTIPQKHNAGAIAYFISYGAGLTSETKYDNDLSLSVKFLPRNSKGALNINSATPMSITTQSRALKPYPVGNMAVNSKRYPSAVAGDAAVSWSHRNRLTQGQTTLYTQDGGSISGGPEGTYTITTYYNGSQVAQTTGTTSTGVTVTAAQRLGWGTDGTKPVKVVVTPVNGSLTGPSHDTGDFIMTGYGMTYGQFYGGV